MKARLVRIGNSRGVRLPKPLILQAGLTDEVELTVQGGTIVIECANRPRSGWGDAAKEAHQKGEDLLLDQPAPKHFDGKEWEW